LSEEYLSITDATCLIEGGFAYVIGGTNGKAKFDIIYRISLDTFECVEFAKMVFPRAMA